MKLTIIMPVLNEQATVVQAIDEVLAAKHICPIELIIIDDGSTDATAELIESRAHLDSVTVVHHARNRGKGAAVRTAMRFATGDYALIFDADLEYDAADIPRVVGPVLRGQAECVFGVRQFAGATAYSFRYMLGNRAMTMTANALFDCWIGDLHTCLKLVPAQLFRELDPVERGFGLDTEISARLLRLGLRPFEVPISYSPRGKDAGKKIGWKDGVACIGILVRERVRSLDRESPAYAAAQRVPAQRRRVDQATLIDIAERSSDPVETSEFTRAAS